MWKIIALILLILFFIAFVKMFLVKSIFDKLVILDVINILIVALLITVSIIFRETAIADIAIVYVLLSLTGILYFAKYIQRN